MVVLVFVSVAVTACGEARIIALGLHTSPELDLVGLKIQDLQGEKGESVLCDRRRQRFLSRGRIVSVQTPEAEASTQNPRLPLLEDPAIGELGVVELGADGPVTVRKVLDFVV